MGDLTASFSRTEFRCPCCGRLPLTWAGEEIPPLAAALQTLRDRAQCRIIVLSGYRCPAHNARVEGAADSQHLLGQAADIVLWGVRLRQAYNLAMTVPEFAGGGIGLYPERGFMHVDVRGREARWGKIGGRYVSIMQALA